MPKRHKNRGVADWLDSDDPIRACVQCTYTSDLRLGLIDDFFGETTRATRAAQRYERSAISTSKGIQEVHGQEWVLSAKVESKMLFALVHTACAQWHWVRAVACLVSWMHS